MNLFLILLFNIKEIETYGPEFLNLSATDILGWVILYCRGLSRAFENVYSILVSVPFDASHTAVTTKNVSRRYQMSPGRQNSL